MLFSGIKNNSDESKDIIHIDPNYIHYNQISIFGSFSSSPNNMIEAMDLVDSKEIDLRRLITRTFSLDKIKDAFQNAEGYNGFKSIINRFK